MKPTHSTGSGSSHTRRLGFTACFLFIAAFSFAIFPGLIYGQGYVQTNLVSDGFVTADFMDANLKNPWGLVQSSGSPFWVSDQATGVSTLYMGSGAKVPLTVTINAVTPPPPPNGPTGIVFNGGTGFDVTLPSGSAASAFIFADLNGNIYGWHGPGTNTSAAVGATVTGGTLTGLAINTSDSDIYAANFTSTGGIVEFDSTWTKQSTTFTDAMAASKGWEPYNVQDINGTLYVAYEPINPLTHRPLQGLGNGLIAEFSETGTFLKDLVSDGNLDDPWGVALAPSSGFGQFSGDLLVGNFGNGVINAYDATTGAFEGTIEFPNGTAITNNGLWALMFGTGGAGSSKTTLYITAGLNNEQDGVLAAIDAVPEPASLLLFGGGLLVLALAFHRKRSAVRG